MRAYGKLSGYQTVTDNDKGGGTPPPLDLLSISQKICTYSAPYLAIVDGEKSRLIQTCCNHWDCPKCGEARAKHEYGRIVSGAKTLSEKHTLYFYTFTCRGKELSVFRAEKNYLIWTNRLLSSMRARCKKEGGFWSYVQVTERQKRGHPHSHLLITWIPGDAQRKMDAKNKPYIYSKWFSKRHTASGLGTQSRITPVESVEGTAKYIAKYLFKETMLTHMPKHWKRIRYSHSFPDAIPFQVDDNVTTFTISTPSDWRRAELAGVTFECADMMVWQVARKHIRKLKIGW